MKKTVEESFKQKLLISEPSLLKDAGFEEHGVCSPGTTAYDIAKKALEKVRPALAKEKIGAIFYAHCLPQNGTVGKFSEFEKSRDVKPLMDFPASHLQADFGLDDAFTVGISQQACCSMLYSIRSARQLLLAEPEVETALCLTADRFPEGAIYEQAYNVISDGAATCTVSRKRGAFRYLAGHAITNGALAQASDDETVGSFFNYTVVLINELLRRANLEMKDIHWIVPQNMNKKAWEILSSVVDFPKERVVFPSMGKVAHMISGDNIVNLSLLLKESRIKKGERVLIPMAGFGLNWHGLILERSE